VSQQDTRLLSDEATPDHHHPIIDATAAATANATTVTTACPLSTIHTCPLALLTHSPGLFDTTAFCTWLEVYPRIAFMRVDFPTLDLPTMATSGTFPKSGTYSEKEDGME
jgi:hypothetical protein